MLEEFECVEWNTTDRNVSVGKTTVRNLTRRLWFAGDIRCYMQRLV